MNPNKPNNNRPRPPRRGNNQRAQAPNPAVSLGLSTSRGQAVRAQKRSQMDAQRIANQYTAARPKQDAQPRRANAIDDRPRLKIIGLGGMDGGGSKNMM